MADFPSLLITRPDCFDASFACERRKVLDRSLPRHRVASLVVGILFAALIAAGAFVLLVSQQ
jgi:hypothetical protein